MYPDIETIATKKKKNMNDYSTTNSILVAITLIRSLTVFIRAYSRFYFRCTASFAI